MPGKTLFSLKYILAELKKKIPKRNNTFSHYFFYSHQTSSRERLLNPEKEIIATPRVPARGFFCSNPGKPLRHQGTKDTKKIKNTQRKDAKTQRKNTIKLFNKKT